MGNMKLYEAVRSVPANAKKTIGGGRLKGMTDINPMWRIKALTEQFGACGIGWKTEIARAWIEDGANGERAAFVEILLFIKCDGAWSNGIPGTGGSMFVAKEKAGLYTSDEAFKMAYTDAISVCCKMLGFGADVYWEQDATKYAQQENAASAPAKQQQPQQAAPPAKPYNQQDNLMCADCGTNIEARVHNYSMDKYGRPLCRECQKKVG